MASKLTDKQIQAHLDGHGKLPPHGHTPEGLEQIRQYQIRKVEEGNRRWLENYKKELVRKNNVEKANIASRRNRTPLLELSGMKYRGSRTYVILNVKARAEQPIVGDRYMLLYRRAGSEKAPDKGWSAYGSYHPLPTEDGTKIIRIDSRKGRMWEIAVMLRAVVGDHWSQPITIDIQDAVEIKEPPKRKAPVPTGPTKAEIQNVKTQAYQRERDKRAEEERIRNQAAHDAHMARYRARLAEGKRVRAAMRKALPVIRIYGKSVIGHRGKNYLMFTLYAKTPNGRGPARSFNIMYRVAGHKEWRSYGPPFTTPPEGESIQLVAGRGTRYELAIASRSRYGSVLSEPLLISCGMEAPTLTEVVGSWKGETTKDGRPTVAALRKFGFPLVTAKQRDAAVARAKRSS